MKIDTTLRLIAYAAIFAVLSGCGGSGGKQTADKEKPPVPVETVAAAAGEVIDGIDVVGSLSPKYETEIKSELTGIVKKVYVNEWVSVKKGAPLIEIDSREMEAIAKKSEAALLQAETRGNRAKREYERVVKLKESGLATQQNLDDAATEKEGAMAAVEAAREELAYVKTRLSKSIIYSPIDGTVSQRNVNVGDLAGEMGVPKILVKIVDNRLLNITVNVPSNEMAAIKPGLPLSFTTDAFPGKEFTGKIMYINPSVNETDRSVKVIAEYRNVPETLKGGLFIKGKIITSRRSNVIRVPRAALTAWDAANKKAEIYIVNNGKAVRKTVVTGAISDDLVEITSGITKGENIITRGGFNVKDGDRITVTNAKGA